MKKNAIVTFDYEVFLGRNTGSIENSVLKPTESILQILRQNNSRAIFFVDATWLLFLKKNSSSDFKKISEQLIEIVKTGSSVELHLHPQWLNASEENGIISFESLVHYKLHSLSNSKIIDLFSQSAQLLESITGQKITCFRAGGWCIHPFETIKEAFEICNIKFDFSVVPGVRLNDGKEYDYDFSGVPRDSFYKFSDSIMNSDETGIYTEIPVSVYQSSFAYRLGNKILLRIKGDKILGDGTGAKERTISKSFFQAIKFSRATLNLDRTDNYLFRFILKTHFRSSPLIVIVSHPKIVSPQSLSNLLYVVKNFNTFSSNQLNDFLDNKMLFQ